MKKIYVNPEISVVKIATQQMLATSAPLSNTEVNEGLGHETDVDW